MAWVFGRGTSPYVSAVRSMMSREFADTFPEIGIRLHHEFDMIHRVFVRCIDPCDEWMESAALVPRQRRNGSCDNHVRCRVPIHPEVVG